MTPRSVKAQHDHYDRDQSRKSDRELSGTLLVMSRSPYHEEPFRFCQRLDCIARG